MHKKILLSGDGGQGIQLISKAVCQTAFENDFHVTSIPNYGLEQRGGVSLNFIQVSDEKLVYPKFTTADLLLVLSPQARDRTKAYVGKDTIVLDVDDYKEKMREHGVQRRGYNLFFLGMITNILKKESIVTSEKIFALLEKKLSSKPGWEDNKKAFEFGLS